MRKIIDYNIAVKKISEEIDIAEFNEQITNLMKNNWQPLGELSIVHNVKLEYVVFHQAMVKYEEEKC